jgi:hypothetical protein
MRLISSLALVALLVGQSAHAATVLRSDVTHEGKRYEVQFEFRVHAEAARVRDLLLDYERRPLADSVQELRLLEKRADGTRRVRVVMRVCVLFICQTMTKNAEMRELPNGDLLSVGDPAEGDFDLIRERWSLTPEGDATRVRYQSELVPRFFIPPLIGPWILKIRLLSELETTADRIERYAQEPYAGRSP